MQSVIPLLCKLHFIIVLDKHDKGEREIKKVFATVIVICLMFVITSCSGGEPSKTPESGNPSAPDETGSLFDSLGENSAEGDPVAQTQGTPENSGLVGCGQIFSTEGLSYNIIGLRTEVFEGSEMLFLKMEIRNDGAENKNYETLSTLELYDEKGELCDNEVFARVESKLYGDILPGGRLVGEAAFNITDRAGDNFELHIGEFYEYSPAIAIKESDIGMTFAEQFGESAPDITYIDFLESDELTIKINGASTVVDDGGQKLLLIDISVMNNGSESTDLFYGLYLDGVYAKSGSKLDSSQGRYWDYPNYEIEPGDTKDGVLAYKIDDGDTEFYMIVAPDSSNYSQKFTLGFSAE
jgi:hypothetical protein